MTTMKQLLRDALSRASVDYCEIRIEESRPLTISFEGAALDRVSQALRYGGAVRALFKGAWGFASFNDLTDLPAMLSSACQQARYAGNRTGSQSELAPVPVVEDEFAPVFTLHPATVTLADKVRLLEHYCTQIVGHDPAIAAAQILYREKATVLHFANTEGTYVVQEKVDVGARLGAIARRGTTAVSRQVGLGSSLGFDCMFDAEQKVKEVCSLAVKLLDASQVKAGVYPVICDPEVAGLFVHEAFGHLSEADNVHRNPALQKPMTLGRRLGRDILTIYDTGEYPQYRGYVKYDDEGVLARRADLVRNGILVGRLHSRETAALMGEQPTGSARAYDHTFPPIVRMRNTCIAPGVSTFDEMIKDIELGVYAVAGAGGETEGEMFTFRAGYGVMIRDGRLAELVKDVKLMGNVFATLENIDMIGDQTHGRGGSGGCGKEGQSPLPTSGVCPAIRIQNVIVGGVR